MIPVVEPGSQHLDWSTPDKRTTLKSIPFHTIISESAGPLEINVDLHSPAITIFGPLSSNTEIVTFTHANIVSAVAAQAAVLPKTEKYTPEDVLVPVNTLSDLYTRIHLYTALAAGSTIALNAIAGREASVESTILNVNPTIIVASPTSLLNLYRQTRGTMIELWHSLIHTLQTRTLVTHGQIPKGNFFTRLNDYGRPRVGSRLRLVFTAELAGNADSQPLNSLDLSDLRIFLKSKVVYALAHHSVAGAIAQQNVFDYRIQKPKVLPSRNKGIERSCAHFGAVMPGCEVWTEDVEGLTADDEVGPRGQVVVKGPVVSGGGPRRLGVKGWFRDDGVLGYVEE